MAKKRTTKTTIDLKNLQDRLWKAADELRANSKLKAGEYSNPVLGLIFLKFADTRFSLAKEEIEGKGTGRRKIGKTDYQARGVMYLPDEARYEKLMELPDSANLGKAVNEAMKAIESENEELKDVLPKSYQSLENKTLSSLLKTFNSVPMDVEGDVFGLIYEYFLGKFAMSEGQRGGQFFTPTSLVRLIVDVIEPIKGRIYDPACGSGGMFVQSARFVEAHSKTKGKKSTISVFGQERVDETVRLCLMNMAVHGLSGDIRQGNSYYEDLHESQGRFDFVMANPPFNVNGIDKERLTEDKRFPFGLPRTDNGNYLWIQHFYSALSKKGRAGFVMANSASDARSSEMEVRKKLIESKAVDVMIAIGSNFFFTVTLPCTLWFLDKGKVGTDREDTILFIDAREIYNQIDRAHRDFTPEQGEFIANIVRLYRGEKPEDLYGGMKLTKEQFAGGKYEDVAGLCKVATLDEVEEQGWSLNAGRYVGVLEKNLGEIGSTMATIDNLHSEFLTLTKQAEVLALAIETNLKQLS